MPQDLEDILPDPRTLVEDSDRRAAEQKYQHALVDQAPAQAGGEAPPAEPTERSHIVAEPPPATVPIAKPVPRVMPRWKVTLIAVAAVVLPLVVFVVAWERHHRGTGSSGGGPAVAMPSATVPAASATHTANAVEAATAATPAPSATVSAEPNVPATARPKAPAPTILSVPTSSAPKPPSPASATPSSGGAPSVTSAPSAPPFVIPAPKY